jgi:hypothetical protein
MCALFLPSFSYWMLQIFHVSMYRCISGFFFLPTVLLCICVMSSGCLGCSISGVAAFVPQSEAGMESLWHLLFNPFHTRAVVCYLLFV